MPSLRELLSDRARNEIHAGTGWVRHEKPDRAHRIGLSASFSSVNRDKCKSEHRSRYREHRFRHRSFHGHSAVRNEIDPENSILNLSSAVQTVRAPSTI